MPLDPRHRRARWAAPSTGRAATRGSRKSRRTISAPATNSEQYSGSGSAANSDQPSAASVTTCSRKVSFVVIVPKDVRKGLTSGIATWTISTRSSFTRWPPGG
ncbi:hypothetical protein WKI71_17330 [Streptomyces sp. MS1.AVA.1]|uniref:Uncharacterized protein n=1 Tax=Streptomyces machairae TaxID=3134109 RepID=A0ABU8UN47_9ACTN